MTKRILCYMFITLGFGLLPHPAAAQGFDIVGARAAGMAGAFVGVADDASSIYWNPAGLAAGSYFSLLLDGTAGSAIPDAGASGRKHSSFTLALTTPALGLSYYRLRTSVAGPDPFLVPIGEAPSSRELTGESQIRVDSLVTHHAGVTLVQSVFPTVAVGATLKLVRGIASSELAGFTTAEAALDGQEPIARGRTKFDVDVGVMATGRSIKAGLTLRNARQPEFDTPSGRKLRLERQARGGVSYALTPAWIVAGDFDLLEWTDAFGERRDAAVGVEGRVARRATVRSGLRFNVAGDGNAADRRALAVGATFAVTAAVMVDAAALTGGDRAGGGWGISARFLY